MRKRECAANVADSISQRNYEALKLSQQGNFSIFRNNRINTPSIVRVTKTKLFLEIDKYSKLHRSDIMGFLHGGYDEMSRGRRMD